MKNPERVAELLVELRDLTDNDFERHRIDVLERDLTNPPTVEVIDEKTQTFAGATFYKGRNSNYFRVNLSLHQFIWRYCVGNIPQGYDIHHKDLNPSNNNITNLQLLTKAEHIRLHKTHEIEHPQMFTCKICGKSFFAVKAGKNYFCSERCRCADKRSKYQEERICIVCGEKFSAVKSNPTKTCSPTCANKLRWQARREKPPKRKIYNKTCVYCGENFSVDRSHRQVKCCSPHCAALMRWEKRKTTQQSLFASQDNHCDNETK